MYKFKVGELVWDTTEDDGLLTEDDIGTIIEIKTIAHESRYIISWWHPKVNAILSETIERAEVMFINIEEKEKRDNEQI